MLCYHARLQESSKKTGLRQKTGIEPITIDRLVGTEREIVKGIEHTSFLEELPCLNDLEGVGDVTNTLRTKVVKKSSPIFKLDPHMKDGLLRVGGRLRNATISQEAKYPMILPKNHHVCSLIVLSSNIRACRIRTCFIIIKRTILDSCC